MKLLECLVRKLRHLLGKGSGTQAKRERENGESVKGRKAMRKMAILFSCTRLERKDGTGKNGEGKNGDSK